MGPPASDTPTVAEGRVLVAARLPEPSGKYRRVRLRESIRDQFWVVPAAFLAGGAVLAALTGEADDLGVPSRISRGLPVSAEAAETILGVIATSMLTFVGVVFTITLVALQLASAQLSPRVLRKFVRSTVTKVAFGTLLGTFTFAIVMLVLDASLKTAEASSRAVTVAFLLVAACLVVFLFYVTATMKLLQVSWVVTAVADETRAAVRDNYPYSEAYQSVPAPVLAKEPSVLTLPAGDGPAARGQLGVVLGVDRGRLVELAGRNDCVLELLPRVGEYVTTGAAIFAAHGGRAPPLRDALDCVHLGRARTMYQDPAFGIRQMVDVASQALSPAINQPSTAVQVIDRLEDVLLRISQRPQPTGFYCDASGVVRLVERPVTWDAMVDLAFREITSYGSGAPQVTRRLMATYRALDRSVPVDLQSAVRRHEAELRRTVGRRVHEGSGPAALAALSADRTGLG